jgi:hypothetical protein
VGDLEGDGSRDIIATPNDATTETFLSGAVAPVFTSAASATFVVDENNTFNVTATGVPPPTFSFAGGYGPVSMTPSGVLTATPASYNEGVYNFTIRAANGAQPDATQNFTLTITRGVPVVSSTNVDEITATSARLWGHVENQGTTGLTRRGVVYARTSVNANRTPRLKNPSCTSPSSMVVVPAALTPRPGSCPSRSIPSARSR